MPKTSKKATTTPVKPITDFFTRKSGTSSQPVSSQRLRPKLSQTASFSASQNAQIPKPTKNNPPPRQDQEVISVSSESHISISSGTRSIITVPSATPSRASSRPVMDTAETLSPHKTPRTVAKSRHLAVPTDPAIDRSHSPEIQYTGFSPAQRYLKKPPGKSKTPIKRKKKFESDSEVEALDSVIYVAKHPKAPSISAPISRSLPLTAKENLAHNPPRARSASRKKPRLSSPDQLTASDIVPSSQSDEQEMDPLRSPTRDPEMVKQSVDQWRQDALLPSPPDALLKPQSYPDGPEVGMDMDVDVSLPVPSLGPSPIPEAEVGTESRKSVVPTRFATPVSRRSLSPLTSPPPSIPSRSLPVTPVPLNAESKTAKIIAEIKARAYAASLSSPEENHPLAEFKDVLEDNSDDDLDDLWKPLDKTSLSTSKYQPKLTETSNIAVASTSHTGRYALRDRKTSSSPSSSNHRSISPCASRRQASIPNKRPTVLTKGNENKGKGPAKKKSPAHDPLEMLLKEKQLADKRGKGSDAFRLAEDAVADKNLTQFEMEGAGIDWTNEQAAFVAVQQREHLSPKSSSPVASSSGGGEVVLDEQDQQRLFGLKRGKEIVGILESDREKMEKGKEREKVLGVSLWVDMETTDEGEQIGVKTQKLILTFDGVGRHPVLGLLLSAVDHGNMAQAKLLLDSGVVSAIQPSESAVIVPYLCELALILHENPLSTSAFRVLSYIWNGQKQAVASIPLTLIISTIRRLGAKPAVLAAMGWTVGPDTRLAKVDAQKREDVLYRLVFLITHSTRSGGLSSQDAPDVLMVLLLIGLDPLISIDLKRDIIVAVDVVCRYLSPGSNFSPEIESTICTKLVKFASLLTPINKAEFVSFLSSGSGRTRRIARWVAHSIIVGADVVPVDIYSDLTPVLDLIQALSPGPGTDSDSEPAQKGIFELHSKTDYVDMGFYVYILSVAISDVDSYVAEERKAPQPKVALHPVSESPSKPVPEKADSPIQLVQSAIEGLHARITDTRAAHLDRSRTKAAFKQVSMRVYYQRLASLKSGNGTGKPRNIQQYFAKS